MTGQAVAAPAGWYPVPGGGRRFWNGRTWTPDVLGAPSAAAEYEGLDPDLPPPHTPVLEPETLVLEPDTLVLEPGPATPPAAPSPASRQPAPQQPASRHPTPRHPMPRYPGPRQPARRQSTRGRVPVRETTVAPGWYPNGVGAMQWWDGAAWGPLAPPRTVIVRPIKETGIAYLFYFLLGGLAAHRLYLGFTASALLFNAIWWTGWLFSPFLIGLPLVMIGGVWLLCDLFRLPSLVRRANAARGYFG